MRSLPRNTRSTRQAIVLGLALIAASVPVALPLAAADDLKNKQDQVKKGIVAAKAELLESSRAQILAAARLKTASTTFATAENALAKTQGELTAAQMRDGQMQARLQQSVRDLKTARHELAKGKARVHEQRLQIGRLAVQSFQYGDVELMKLSVILNSQNPADVTNQMNTVDNLISRNDSVLEKLKALRTLLVVQEAKVTRVTAEIGEQRKAAAANLVRRKQLEATAHRQRNAVAALVVTRRKAEQAAESAKMDDLRQIAKLKQESNRIKAQIMARAAKQSGGFRGNTGGFLNRPVDGPVTSPFGYRVHPIYGYYSLHDGTDFGAGCGQNLFAVANGTVVSEYYQTAWGNRLLLDLGKVNGKNVTVIYNHLSGYRVRTGARVKRGSVVGYVGTTGWSTGCHLHFTVLVNGEPVNPMNWI